MVNAAADIQQAAAAAGADVKRGLQEVYSLTLFIRGKEVLKHALQHLFIRVEGLQLTRRILQFFFQL